MKRYQTKLDNEAKQLQIQASQLLANKQKDRAVLLLKLRRFKLEEAKRMDQQLLNILQLISTIEWETQSFKVCLSVCVSICLSFVIALSYYSSTYAKSGIIYTYLCGLPLKQARGTYNSHHYTE